MRFHLSVTGLINAMTQHCAINLIAVCIYSMQRIALSPDVLFIILMQPHNTFSFCDTMHSIEMKVILVSKHIFKPSTGCAYLHYFSLMYIYMKRRNSLDMLETKAIALSVSLLAHHHHPLTTRLHII